MTTKTPLPQSIKDLPVNVVIQRCAICNALVFVKELCKTQIDMQGCETYRDRVAQFLN